MVWRAISRDAALPGLIVLAALLAFGVARATSFGPPPGWQGPLAALRDRLEPPAPPTSTALWEVPGARRPSWSAAGALACEGTGGTYLVRGDEARLHPGEGRLAGASQLLVVSGNTLRPLLGGPPLLEAQAPLREVVSSSGGIAALDEAGALYTLQADGPVATWRLPAGAQHLALAPGGRAAVFALPRGEGSTRLTRLDLRSGAPLDLGPGDWPAFAEDGTLLWIQPSEDGWELRSDRGPLISSVSPHALHSAGDWVALTRAGEGSTVTLARVDGSAAIEVETGVVDPRDPALYLGPGGPALAFTAEGTLHRQSLPLALLGRNIPHR
ncbi:MAG: hypothetical protein JXX28_17285 [Deltaproteobacteria bacterium]|nr:hypothetical protein [Deltaproteobacteria bacterium]